MDLLSQLLALGRMRVRLDVHCLLSGSYTIAHEPQPAGEAPFHLVLAGTSRLATPGGQVALRPGDFLLLPRGSAHEVASARKARAPKQKAVRFLRADAGRILPIKSNLRRGDAIDLDLLCGRFVCDCGAGSILLQALPEIVHVNLFDAAGGESLDALIALLRDEATHSRPGGLAIVDALGQAILTRALRAYGERESGSANFLALAADARLGQSVRAVLQDPARNWTIASLGETVAMSRATYARRFQTAAGMSVADFLQRVRMIHACEWLRQSDRGLAEIAQRVGYQSESAFRNVFHATVGMSPGRWRRQQRHGAAAD